MNELTLIYPHQLFLEQPTIKKGRRVALVEHPHFFTAFHYHKQKLILHRATMQDYLNRLVQSGYQVDYIEFSDYEAFTKTLKSLHLHVMDPIEHVLQKELKQKKLAQSVSLYPSTAFLTPKELVEKFLSKKKEKRLSMQSFYIEQRKHLNILMKEGRPIGNKWSFDTENRKALPKGHKSPSLPLKKPNPTVFEAIDYVESHFSQNPGSSAFYLPIDHEETTLWFDDFLKKRFDHFGLFEDAILSNEPFLYHSVLSPLLNIGLITPAEIVKKVLDYGNQKKIPLNSLEGFIRQVVGWREFMKICYDHEGEEMRKSNQFDHRRKIPSSYYTATTGITPIDSTIKKINQFAYCHHIERLMILGNFMLLSEFDPQDVYRWFMEFFIDAYDWVMVPNVFAMSQYADGGQITSKPYISSSNYLLKMSDYKKENWCEIWDALYWFFIHRHRSIFSKNPRMTMMIALLDKMDKTKKSNHFKTAKAYLSQL